MKAFILAGGFATRLWPLTENRAKPLLPLAGKPIISYLVEKIPEDVPITVSTNAAFGDDFEEWKKETGRENIEILVEQTRNDDQKLGALGATAQWIEQEKIDDDVLLLTGDNYCGFSFAEFLGAAKEETALLAAFDIGSIELASSFGTVITKQETRNPSTGLRTGKKQETMEVTGFEEKPKEPRSTLINTGCYFLPASTLSILVAFAKDHPDDIGKIFEEFLQKALSVECFTFDEPWFDIGSFQAYLDSTQTLVGQNLQTEEGALVKESEIEGSVVVGRNSEVRRSHLYNVVVFENCIIEDCELRDCIIDNNCTLERVDLTGKMLRTGTKLKVES